MNALSWLPTLPTAGYAVLAAVPFAILLLYFLKLRREPVEVPSTYLWAATIEDLHVNSLLQRLRRSLLLFLQLAAVALAALALFRPGIRGEASQTSRRIFLLDSSASMLATDGSDAGMTRFDKAKQLIGQTIDSMTDDEAAMLITFDDRAETLQSFTSDRSRLRAALDRCTASARTTDILGALRAADGLANPRRSSELGDVNDVQVADAQPADLVIYSDGGFDPVTEFSLGNLIPQYVAMGTPAPPNIAITAMSAQRNMEQSGRAEVFATVANLGGTAMTTTATLKTNGTFLDAQKVSLEPGDQTGISFELETEDATQLELSLDVEDALAVDNRAFAALSPLRTVRVLIVTPGNKPLELGLGTEKIAGICQTEVVSPDYLSGPEYRDRAKVGSDDLMIFDRCSPPILPQTNTFFIGDLPPPPNNARAIQTAAVKTTPAEPSPSPGTGDASTADPGWRYSGPVSPLTVIDVDRSHPLMQYLDLFSLLVVSGRPVAGPVGAKELVGADIGPVLTIAPRDGYQDLVLGFDLISTGEDGGSLINTNWYAERSWPVFLLNLLRDLAGASEAYGAASHQPGNTVRVRLPRQIEAVSIRNETDGSAITLPMGNDGIIEFTNTEATGNYSVRAGDKLLDLFSINLFNRTESTLATAPKVEIGYEQVQGETDTGEERHEYWRLALILMLGLLGVEWFLFGRRVS